MNKKKVLIVGGTGYLGQHTLRSFSTTSYYDVAFTYNSAPPPQKLLQTLSHCSSFHVDLSSGLGFDSVSSTFGLVIHSSYYDQYHRNSQFTIPIRFNRSQNYFDISHYDYMISVLISQ